MVGTWPLVELILLMKSLVEKRISKRRRENQMLPDSLESILGTCRISLEVGDDH